MFKYLIKGLQSGVAISLVAQYRRSSIQLLRIAAARAYLHGVRMARLSAMGLMQIALMIGLICLGTLLLHAALFILLPWTLKTKALLAILLGSSYVATGGLALRAAMDEKTWMAKSGATKMLNAAVGRPALD